MLSRFPKICLEFSDVPSVLHLQRVAGHPPDPSHPLDLLPHQGNEQAARHPPDPLDLLPHQGNEQAVGVDIFVQLLFYCTAR